MKKGLFLLLLLLLTTSPALASHSLVPQVSLSGSVSGGDGFQPELAVVVITSESELVEAPIDRNGRFVATNLPDGAYTVELKVPKGFVATTLPQTLDLKAGANVVVNLEAEKEPIVLHQQATTFIQGSWQLKALGLMLVLLYVVFRLGTVLTQDRITILR